MKTMWLPRLASLQMEMVKIVDPGVGKKMGTVKVVG